MSRIDQDGSSNLIFKNHLPNHSAFFFWTFDIFINAGLTIENHLGLVIMKP